MSSPSAVGAQKMPPQKRRRVRCRRSGEAGPAACPGAPRCRIPPPSAAPCGAPEGLSPAALPGGSPPTRVLGAARCCPATPEPHAGARPPVAAPRHLDSDFPRGRSLLPPFPPCLDAGGGSPRLWSPTSPPPGGSAQGAGASTPGYRPSLPGLRGCPGPPGSLQPPPRTQVRGWLNQKGPTPFIP